MVLIQVKNRPELRKIDEAVLEKLIKKSLPFCRTTKSKMRARNKYGETAQGLLIRYKSLFGKELAWHALSDFGQSEDPSTLLRINLSDGYSQKFFDLLESQYPFLYKLVKSYI